MNYATHTIGNAANVISRLGTESITPTVVRPEKLLDVLCLNNTAGLLYMQIFEVQNTIVTISGAGDAGSNQTYALQGTRLGLPQWVGQTTATYSLAWYGSFWQVTNNGIAVYSNTAQVPWEGTWSLGAGAAPGPTVSTPTAVAPANGTVPRFSFPVQPNLGGTLGRTADMDGIFCAWSTTANNLTLVGAAAGSIEIVLKG